MEETPAEVQQTQQNVPQATVIPGADSLIGDLLDIDLSGPTPFQQQQQQVFTTPSAQPLQNSAGMDFLGEGLDSLVSGCCINI